MSLEEVAEHFLEAFMLQFGHGSLIRTEDVLGLCKQLKIAGAGGGSTAAQAVSVNGRPKTEAVA